MPALPTVLTAVQAPAHIRSDPCRRISQPRAAESLDHASLCLVKPTAAAAAIAVGPHMLAPVSAKLLRAAAAWQLHGSCPSLRP